MQFDSNPNTETIWIYGDDGHDEIWGADEIPIQYLFGGEGDDLMYGGDDLAAGFDGINYMHGGAGDDIILPGNMNYGETKVRGGKGDDKINVYNEKADGTSIVDADGVYDFTELAMLVSMIWSTLHYCYEQIQLQILVNYNICVIVCESII